MSPSGGPPRDPWERLRPVPRPVRAAPPSDEFPPPEPPLPRPAPPAAPPDVPRRPDRSRMAAISLDRSASRKLARVFKTERQSQIRNRRTRHMDRWLFRLVMVIGATLVAGGLWRIFRIQPAARELPMAPAVSSVLRPSDRGDRTLRMLAAFLAAPDAGAKSLHVLDRVRVLPLMLAAEASGNLPEATLTFGVPAPGEEGIVMVPAQAGEPSPFPLHLVVREVNGSPLLDWETYEQEMTRRFLRFAAVPGTPGGDFRLMIERVHAFGQEPGPVPAVAVRVAAPGSAALAQAVMVSPQARPAITAALPWNQRRRALVRLRWETPADTAPRLILEEIVRWDFLP